MTTKISDPTAQKILDSLIGKDIFFLCGYGGVMLVEIGKLEQHCFEPEAGKHATRTIGQYRVFCDENWSFSDGKGTQIDRWTSSTPEANELFESIGVQKLERIEVISDFEKTIFHISGGHSFAIRRDDAIETFSIALIPEKTRLSVSGNGTIEYQDYEEDLSFLQKSETLRKLAPTITIERSFLRNQIPDSLHISSAKAKEFIQPILHQQIRSIDVTSGTRFTLCLGEDSRKSLSKDDQINWPNPMNRWELSIDEVWILKKNNEIVLDVRQERFHFEEKLASFLKNKQILEINFDRRATAIEIKCNEGYSLTLLDTNRYSSWQMYDRQTGLRIGSQRDLGLVYTINVPAHLSDANNTGDIHLDAVLYELAFYRNYFAEGDNLL